MVSNPFEKIRSLQRCEGQRSWKETLPHQILFSGKVVKGFFHDVPATFPQIHDAQSCFSRPRDASSFVLGLGAFAERPWRNCKTIVWHVCASKLRLMIIHTFNDKFIRLSTEEICHTLINAWGCLPIISGTPKIYPSTSHEDVFSLSKYEFQWAGRLPC